MYASNRLIITKYLLNVVLKKKRTGKLGDCSSYLLSLGAAFILNSIVPVLSNFFALKHQGATLSATGKRREIDEENASYLIGIVV
jgi:hypothetical protein